MKSNRTWRVNRLIGFAKQVNMDRHVDAIDKNMVPPNNKRKIWRYLKFEFVPAEKETPYIKN